MNFKSIQTASCSINAKCADQDYNLFLQSIEHEAEKKPEQRLGMRRGVKKIGTTGKATASRSGEMLTGRLSMNTVLTVIKV